MIHYGDMHQFNAALSGALKEAEEKGDLRSDDDCVKKVKELLSTNSGLFDETHDISEAVSLIKSLKPFSEKLKSAGDQDPCCGIALKTVEQAFRFLSKDDIAASLATLRELEGVEGGQELYEESLGLWVSEHEIPIKSLGLNGVEMLRLAPHLTYLDLTDGKYGGRLGELTGCTFSEEFIGKLLNNSPNLNSLLIKRCKISRAVLRDLPNPQRLLQLTMEGCDAFNQPLWALAGLQELTMRSCSAFNQGLPAGLQELTMRSCSAFNQSLPAGLQELTMRSCSAFNQSLPAGVQQLEMIGCRAFNQSLPELTGLKELTMKDCSAFNHRLPLGLQQLAMEHCHIFDQSLPLGIRRLEMHHCRAFNKGLPAALQQLTMEGNDAFNYSLPVGVQQLTMVRCDAFNQSLLVLAGLQQLTMKHCPAFNHWLPAGLEQLTMEHCPIFNQSLPAGLQQLIMKHCDAFNQNLPHRLQQLTMECCSAFDFFTQGESTLRVLLRTSRKELSRRWRALSYNERKQVVYGKPFTDRLFMLFGIDSDIKRARDIQAIEGRVAKLRDLSNYVDVLRDVIAFFPHLTIYLFQHRRDEMIADLEGAGIRLEYLSKDLFPACKLDLLRLLSPDMIVEVISDTPKEERDRWLQESISYDRFQGDVVSVLREVHQKNIEGAEGSALEDLGPSMSELLNKISLKTLAAWAADPSSEAVALAYTPFMDDLQLAVVIPCLNVEVFLGQVANADPATHKGLLAHASSAQKMAYIDADPLSFPSLQKWGAEYHPSLTKLVESCQKDATYEALEREWGMISNRVKPEFGVGYKDDSTREEIDPRKVGQIPVTLERVKDALNTNVVDPELQKKIRSYCERKLGEYETALAEFQRIKETIDSLLRVEIPREFCDPLTSCTMKEPYKAPGGVVMDKTSWDIWFEEGNTTSPEVKGIVSDLSVKVSEAQLVPCKELKDSIETFGKEHPEEVAKANEALKRIELPEELYDPVSGVPMEDPYRAPGGAMDKSGWEDWFASGETFNPFLTPKGPLAPGDIQPDNELRAKIRIFKTAHPEAWEKANE